MASVRFHTWKVGALVYNEHSLDYILGVQVPIIDDVRCEERSRHEIDSTEK